MAVHGWGIARHRLAAALGRIHGDVGGAHEGVDVLAVIRITGDPHAGIHGERHGIDAERLAQGRHQVACVMALDRLVERGGQQHRELVSAQPAEQPLAWGQ